LRHRPVARFRKEIALAAVSVINFTVWFAITFYVYLQTRSVFATGVVSGIFLVMTAMTGMFALRSSIIMLAVGLYIYMLLVPYADRGLALIFVLTGVVGLSATTLALRSRPYQRLSRRYVTAAVTASEPTPPGRS
jgi:hypothetical protein